MADIIRAVTFTTPAATGLFPITHADISAAGATFSAAILIFTRETSDDTDNNHCVLGVGFIAPDTGATTEEHGFSIQVSNASATTPDCNTDHDNVDRAINAMAGDATTTVIAAEFNAAISGGVQLNFTTVAAGPVQSKGTAILFANLSRVYTDGCTSNAGGVVTDTGGATNFEADLVVFTASDNQLGGLLQNASPNLGFAANTSPIQQACAYMNFDDGQEPTDSDGFLRSDDAFGHILAVGRTAEWAHVDPFSASGFTATANAGTPDAHMLALKFSEELPLFCGNLPVSSGTGVQSFSVGFTPQIIFGMATLLTTEDTLTDGQLVSSMGYFIITSSYQRAYTVHREEAKTNVAAAPFNAETRQGDHALLLYNHTGDLVWEAELSSITANGFDLNFTTGSEAGMLTLLAIGSGSLTSVQSETEQISDQALVVLNRKLSMSETVQISDDNPLLFEADGLSDQGIAGAVFGHRAVAGAVFQQVAVAGEVG